MKNSWLYVLLALLVIGCMEVVDQPPSQKPDSGLSGQIRTILVAKDKDIAALAQATADSSLSDTEHRKFWNDNYILITDKAADQVSALIKKALESGDRKAVWLEVKKAYTR